MDEPPPIPPPPLPAGDPRRRCGDCAWRDPGGPCRFAARGTDPGPTVDASTPACVYWEPPPSCDPCGACCREAFDSVPVTDDDATRLGADHADLLRHHDDGWRDLRRVPAPSGEGTWCAALRGDGSARAPFRCIVYALRPTNCHDLDPGSSGCLVARRRLGITPLLPGERPRGSRAFPEGGAAD